MAIIQGSALGSFKGKLGNLVCYQLNGKNVVRSAPGKSKKNKIGTPLQNVYRSKFTKLQHFLQPIILFIRVGFNLESHLQLMTAHNAAKSYNMLNAFREDGEIDCSKVVVSFGNLPGAADVAIAVDDVGFHFSWANNALTHTARSDDQVMLLAYSPSKRDAQVLLSGAKRKAGQETLELWSGCKGNSYHVWMAFISDDRQRISMSSYLGEVTF